MSAALAEPAAELAPEERPHDPAPPTLELVLAPEDLPQLARVPGLAWQGPARNIALIWHDNPEGELASQDLILAREGRVWRLERLRPRRGATWPSALPPPILASGPSPAGLHPAPPSDVLPVAAFQGRRRRYRSGLVELAVCYGALRSVVGERKVCRLTLGGPAVELAALADRLAASLKVGVPRATLAQEGIAVASGADLPPRYARSTQVSPDLPVSEGLAHLLADLLDAALHWTDRCRHAVSAEAVHQARVTTRRLRSALSIYKREAACPELEALAPALKDCAARLGAAREWDVFLDSIGARLTEGRADDPRVATLLRTARRRRAEAYAMLHAYLESAESRQLEVALACAAALRPWERTADPAPLQRTTAHFAADALRQQVRRVRKAGRDLDELPIPALHELRKKCKRLRYAAEFFAPGFPGGQTRIFLKRLAALQEELGHLNDSAAGSGLLKALGPVGRGYAGGLVEGLTAASAGSARLRIGKAWKRFRAAPHFPPD